MVNPTVNVNDIPQAIQLALGPVFLLTGIAGMLNVMTGRLARIIDRGRRLTENPLPQGEPVRESLAVELACLERRRHLASAAITSCTLAALLVCMVIATLFLEEMLDAPLKAVVGILFTGSTLTLVVGLAFFLREVHLATQTVRIPSSRGGLPPPM
jgi:hypothetical protein